MRFSEEAKNVILWFLSMFLVLMGIGGFFYSVVAGIVFLFGGLVSNPLLLDYCKKRHVHINAWLVIFVAIVCCVFGFVLVNRSNTYGKMANNDHQITVNDTADEQETDIVAQNDEPSELLSTETENIPTKDDNDSELIIYYIDVGQGDATLIVCNGEAMLIDGGNDSKGTFMQKFLYDHNISKLKYVIATHPDADHIGGLDVIVTKFDCETIFMPEVEKDTDAYESLINAINYRYYKINRPNVEAETLYYLGDAYFQILSPRLVFSDSNDNSIVINLHHYNNKFIFLGDASIPPQQEMMFGGLDIRADVIKVSHHGSHTAYLPAFYDEVNPRFAVISCGKDNGYGHPHDEVLSGLKERSIPVIHK